MKNSDYRYSNEKFGVVAVLFFNLNLYKLPFR